MGFHLDQDGLEAPLVPHAPVAAIESLGVDAVELPHSARQRRFERLEQKVVVIAHEHEGVEAPVESVDDSGHVVQKTSPVPVIPEDPSLFVAPARDVPNGSGKLLSEWTCHLGRVEKVLPLPITCRCRRPGGKECQKPDLTPSP